MALPHPHLVPLLQDSFDFVEYVIRVFVSIRTVVRIINARVARLSSVSPSTSPASHTAESARSACTFIPGITSAAAAAHQLKFEIARLNRSVVGNNQMSTISAFAAVAASAAVATFASQATIGISRTIAA